jgi:hypothetical protein
MKNGVAGERITFRKDGKQAAQVAGTFPENLETSTGPARGKRELLHSWN